MGRMGAACLVYVSLAVHHHGYEPLSVRVEGQLLLIRVYMSFHRGSSGGHLLVEQDIIGVVGDRD
jgi:hypothetical protein